MTHRAIAVAVVLGVVAAGAAGYFLGARAERATLQSSIADAQASKTLVVIRRDIQLLTEMRQKKHLDLVKDAELWTVLQLQQIDPSKFVKGSGADYLYPQTLEMVNAYRKQFPDTIINPERDPTISKAFIRIQ
jgi:ABC-type phosphate transport system substrate-binding protein